MAIKDVVKKIREVHDYRVTSSYWGRVGKMWKNYGEETLIEAVSQATPKNISLTGMLNIIEVKCQYILENGKGSIDDLINDILNIGDDE